VHASAFSRISSLYFAVNFRRLACKVSSGSGTPAGAARPPGRVAGTVTRPGSHRTVRTLVVYGSSGRRVMTPVAGRFATSNHPHSAMWRVGGDDHRRRRCLLCLADRLRHSRPEDPKPVPGPPAGGPFRVFCCRDRQTKLHRHFFDRDRLPLPARINPARSAGITPAFRYYAVLRLLLGHRPSSFRPRAYRPTGRDPADLPG